MESLQQATDGDGQRRNAQRYQESNITLRRYIEDEQVQETDPKGWWEALLVIKARSFTAQRAAEPETNRGAKISDALREKKKAFCQLCISTAKSKRHTVSVQAVKQDHMVSEGYRQIQSATLRVPTHSVFSRLFARSDRYDYAGFVHSSENATNNKIKSSLRCRKKVHVKHNIHWSTFTAYKVEPMCPNCLDSKLMQHSSFPSKPLVTTHKCGASNELLELEAPSHCSRSPLSYQTLSPL